MYPLRYFARGMLKQDKQYCNDVHGTDFVAGTSMQQRLKCPSPIPNILAWLSHWTGELTEGQLTEWTGDVLHTITPWMVITTLGKFKKRYAVSL